MKSFWLTLICVTALWLAALVAYWLNVQDPWQPGLLTALNAFFSALAFGAVFWNLHRQRQDQKLDRFRSRYFQSLSMYHASVRDVQNDDVKGVGAIMAFENKFLGEIDSVGNMKPDKLGAYLGRLRTESPSELTDALLQSCYAKFIEREAGGAMAHVLRMQFELVQMVSDARKQEIVDEEEEAALLNVFRASLSDPELHLMLYDGLSDRVPPTYREQLDHYSLLRGLLLKRRPFVENRIPEIARYPKTYSLRRW